MCHVYLRRTCILLLLGGLFYRWLCGSSWFIVLLKSLISLLTFCLVVVSVMKVYSTDFFQLLLLNCPILCSILSAFVSCFFGGPLLSGAFIIVLSSGWIDYFITIKYQSLPLITIYHGFCFV